MNRVQRWRRKCEQGDKSRNRKKKIAVREQDLKCRVLYLERNGEMEIKTQKQLSIALSVSMAVDRATEVNQTSNEKYASVRGCPVPGATKI